MLKIVSLTAYREQKRLHLQNLAQDGLAKPHLHDGDIWTRDYAAFENRLFAILKLREILGYYRHYSEEWKHLLLSLLDEAWRDRRESFARTAAGLRRYMAEEMDAENRREMSLGLLLLDLMEKSRPRRETPRPETSH